MEKLANAVQLVPANARGLTSSEFQTLAATPPELEWFANITSKATRRAYENALKDFTQFIGIRQPDEFRIVTRAHVIAWRDDLVRRSLSGLTVRHRLAALSSLFQHLCDRNAVTQNPVNGVKRPPVDSQEGKTPALSDDQARSLLLAPRSDDLKGKRDQAMLATLLYHALRRDELSKLTVKDCRHERRGVAHLKVTGKGGKTRYVPLHPAARDLIAIYLEADGRPHETTGSLFRPLKNNRPDADVNASLRGITPDAIYKMVTAYSAGLGFKVGAHALRATAATNALDHQADIAKVQEWLGHANIATTRIYDRRRTRPEESPTFKVNY